MRAFVPLLFLVACSNDIQVADGANQPPSVVINSPETGSAFLATDVVEFVATVNDPNGIDDIA